ncbi:MAG: tRNA epoxyqueuosine(34) reductase QueG [Candidatus Marinimicrobia bacterium]|nr:tRNA epoxyqueuosine(34) reductase QueG [Candidatus Neomarinimicrobiota bacterium]
MKTGLSYRLKTKALKFGFQKVGITQAVPTPKEKANLKIWLAQGHHGTMEWIEKRKEKRGDIFNYFPNAKSIISVGMNYFSGYKQENIQSDYKFSNYAWGDDYHDILKSGLYKLLGWLKDKDPDVKGFVCVDTSPIMDKVWAQRAGLGWQGKHTNLITRDYGSWLFLGELILDITLDYDKPFADDLCGSCTACIDVCPTKALGEYEIYAEKCISYLTIEHRGQLPDVRSELYNWIYGCDICQEICPWNQKFSRKTDKKYFHPREEIITWTDENWQALDEEGFRKLFKGSAVKRTKFSGLSRNIKLNEGFTKPDV